MQVSVTRGPFERSFVTLDAELARRAEGIVVTATIEALQSRA
jgi:hypothetical protein